MERFDDLIFIKESLINGGKLYKAKLSNQVGEPHSPNYYKTINIEKATFIRIESLEEVNLSDVDKDYCAISGKSIRDVIKASVPCFYIRRR